MDPRYPVGKFEMPAGVTPAMRQVAIEEITAAPGKIRAAIAGLDDAQHAAPEVSLRLLEPLHERWVRLLKTLTPQQFARPVRHPESGLKNVDWLLFLYAWHSRHHTAHITELRKQKGWSQQ